MKYDDATGEFVKAPPSFGEVEETDLTDPAGRINFHIGMALRHGRMAIAHIILAGWELSKQKAALGYGRWADWCGENLSISYRTADRYIMFFAKTVGAVRAARQIPFARRVTRAELEEATVGLEEKSVTRAMVDLGIVRRKEGWGGRREGAGRKPSGLAEELDAAAALEPALWAAARGALDALLSLDAERALFSRLSTPHLSDAAGLLADLCGRARASLARRLEGGGE